MASTVSIKPNWIDQILRYFVIKIIIDVKLPMKLSKYLPMNSELFLKLIRINKKTE